MLHPSGTRAPPSHQEFEEIFGYKSQRWRKVLCFVGYIFSVGFLKLLFYWKPELDVWSHCVPCHLADADTILIRTTGEFKDYMKKLVMQVNLHTKTKAGNPVISDEDSTISKSIMEQAGKVRFIQVQKIRYVWIPSERKFVKIGALEEGLSCSDIHTKYSSGLTKEEQKVRQQICGLNTITVKIIPVWKILFKEVFNPFYVFQVYTLCVWIATLYFEYTSAILLMNFISISATVYNLRKQSGKLHRMSTSYNSILVSLLHKNGEVEEVQSQALVPGDVIVLGGNKLYLPCDAILISGGCTVNEAMLTGESIPVTKTPLPNINNSTPWMEHSGDDYKKHVLYCGTEVIQTKRNGHDPVKAVVLQTGFNTAKGDLVRCILYNKPMNAKLHREAFKFLMILVAFCICAVIYTAIVQTLHGVSVREIVLMPLLTLTGAVNAALPASITICLLYGQTRLKKQGIFCISPQRINLSGQLNLVCFDKTGTLTEDILDLYGVLPCEKSCFQDMIYFTSSNNLCWSPLLEAMTSCHSLIKLDGKLQGDPMDLKMFEGTGWELEDYKTKMNENDPLTSCTMVKPGPNAAKAPVEGILILHQFPFSSSLQRMSVITQVIGESNMTVFMKGAPEMVVRFCKPETVPNSFSKELDDCTIQGFRVIGLAYRSLQKGGLPRFSDIDRELVECDLTFLGLMFLENRLKPETNSALQELSEANIRVVMITGDNLQTALTVGKKSGMIPPGSNIIMLEACEPENDMPASINWKSLTESQANKNKSKESHINVGEGWINIPTTLGNFHFAMNGKTFEVLTQHFSYLLPKILLNGTIYARMTPKQKANLVEEIQKLDYFVGMCGDGANDCGALKMAHSGISLSELEASVASPFTSKIPNIKCVPLLIKEGRNSLATSFSIIKFLTMYQFIGMVCMLLLFWKKTLFGNYQYLVQDLSINVTVSLTMSLNRPARKLAPYRPTGQLLSPPLLLSIFMHLTFAVIVQITFFFLLQQQPWFSDTDVFSACLPLNYSTGNETVRQPAHAENYLTTTMFPITCFNFITLEIAFARGRPFRQPLYTNYMLSTIITIQTATNLFLLFADIESLYTAMELVCTPYYWRVYILIMALVLFTVSYIAEIWFIGNRKLWLWIKKRFNYKSNSLYRKLQRRIQKDPEWPPQNRTDYAAPTIAEKSEQIIETAM